MRVLLATLLCLALLSVSYAAQARFPKVSRDDLERCGAGILVF